MDKNKYNNGNIDGLGKILQSGLKKIGKEYFGTRAKLNKEKVLVLSKDKGLISDIHNIRTFLNIPELNSSYDFRLLEYQGMSMEDSVFLYGKNNNYIIKFEREIRKLLKKYSLPINFTDWIEHAVLYNKFLKTVPKYNPGIVGQIANDTKEAKRIGLTTKEKQFIKDFIRLKMKTEKRPKEEFDYFYKTICSKIKNSKNHNRPSRSIDTAIKAIGKKETITYKDITSKTVSTKHFSFGDLVDKISLDERNESETKKIANKLRQQKYRILRKVLPNDK